jgi:hypothetical protein
MAVIPHFDLPGRFPLIGDVSPDCPPAWLEGLLPGREGGWLAALPAEERALVEALKSARPVDCDALRLDGWLKCAHGPWSALVHASPEGWSHMPGHGHQDLGSFELHWNGVPVLIDPGRGTYEDCEAARADVSALHHNGLSIDGADPYPPNRPYYAPSFRREVVAKPPVLSRCDGGMMLRHHGFSRLGGIGTAERRLSLTATAATIADHVAGGGYHGVERRLVTTLQVAEGGRLLVGPGVRFRIQAGGAFATEPVTVWHAYGEGRPATVITIAERTALPWNGELRIEAVPCAD